MCPSLPPKPTNSKCFYVSWHFKRQATDSDLIPLLHFPFGDFTFPTQDVLAHSHSAETMNRVTWLKLKDTDTQQPTIRSQAYHTAREVNGECWKGMYLLPPGSS